MAQLKRCPFCKGRHKKESVVRKCARKNGPEAKWDRSRFIRN